MSMRYAVFASILAAFFVRQLPAQRNSSPVVPLNAVAEQSNSRFRLFATQNVWTFLLLDSSTGRVWQLQYALSDTVFAGRLALNDSVLVPVASERPGRFSLRETQNVYNFLLLDQYDGRVWQLQWSMEEQRRGIVRSLSAAVSAPTVPPNDR
jgi:hypothetical protein